MLLLRQSIRPEFLNRVDDIIMFTPLLKKEIRGIVSIQLNALRSLVAQSGIQLQFSEYALDFLAEQGFDPQLGARPLKRLIQKEIVNQLSKRILAGDIDKTQPVLIDVFDNTVVFRNEVPVPIAIGMEKKGKKKEKKGGRRGKEKEKKNSRRKWEKGREERKEHREEGEEVREQKKKEWCVMKRNH